jgi:hypothetical protein
MSSVRAQVFAAAALLHACRDADEHEPGESTRDATSADSTTAAPTDTSADSDAVSTTGDPSPCADVHDGDLLVDDTTDLATLVTIREVTGSVTISRSDPPLADLSALGCLERIGGNLIVDETPVLADLTGLGRLSYLGKILTVQRNADMTSLAGLDSLRYVPYIHVNSGPSLERLGLRALQAVETITIGSCNNDASSPGSLPSLAEIDAMDEMLSLGRLEVFGPTALTSLDGLRELAGRRVHVGSLKFWMNPDLPIAEIEDVAGVLGVSVDACANLGQPVEDCFCPID